MAAPNLQSPISVTLKALVATLGTASTTVLANAASSGKAIKLSSVVVANNDTASAVAVTVQLSSGTVSFSICNAVSVPAKASLLVVSRDNPVYLTEDTTVKAFASAAAKLDVTGAYEEIT